MLSLPSCLVLAAFPPPSPPPPPLRPITHGARVTSGRCTGRELTFEECAIHADNLGEWIYPHTLNYATAPGPGCRVYTEPTDVIYYNNAPTDVDCSVGDPCLCYEPDPPSPPPPSPPPLPPRPPRSPPQGLAPAVVAGAVLGGAVLFALASLLLWYVYSVCASGFVVVE